MSVAALPVLVDQEPFLSSHCRQRCQERGIPSQILRDALRYGIVIQRGEKREHLLPPGQARRMGWSDVSRCLRVVVREHCILTAYWA